MSIVITEDVLSSDFGRAIKGNHRAEAGYPVTDASAPTSVTFRFDRPKPGAPLDANGRVEMEEVVLVVPLADIVPTSPPLELSLVPDAALLQVYANANKLPGDIEGDWLLAEIMKRGLDA